MQVRPKRNKPFVCDECEKEIDTSQDYDKIISVHFSEGKKFRNKFCSLDCFEKWKLLSKKPNGNKIPLEVEVSKISEAEKEDFKEEEETSSEKQNSKNTKPVKYKIDDKEGRYSKQKAKEIDVSKTRESVECINWTDKKGSNIVKYPGMNFYDRQGSLQKNPKYATKDSIKKFLDYFNIFKTKHDRGKYK